MYVVIEIFIFIFALGLFWYYISQLKSIISGAPYIPSAKRDIATILELAQIKPGMKMYELGSGDGRILIAAAKAGAVCTGIEINSWMVFYSRLKARLSKVNIEIRRGDIFHYSYTDADVIFIYMLPGLMKKIEPKLQNELKRGAKVISKGFTFSNWKPTEQKNGIYYYTKN